MFNAISWVTILSLFHKIESWSLTNAWPILGRKQTNVLDNVYTSYGYFLYDLINGGGISASLHFPEISFLTRAFFLGSKS